MSIEQQASEAGVMKIATVAQYGGGGTAVLFGLTASEWSVIGVIGGLLIALAGFIVNWHYKHLHLQIAREKLDMDDDSIL